MSGPGVAEAHGAALAGLPAMTPVRLARLLADHDPVAAWEAVRAGTHPADSGRRFTAAARAVDVDAVGERYRRAGVEILLPCSPRYPSMLVSDPGAPALLFAHGDPSVVEGRRRVAIVGTRSATPYGRQVASELGRELAAAGVVVVSGLARGIDGAAHAGALRAVGEQAAPPVAVVGTGLDVVYPSSNAPLWAEVAARGAVLAESSLGTPPHPGVFPARNRIIAALADVVVVVESQIGGGSLYTAEAAGRRGIPVCAVPGSVRSRASEGTNGLLVDGCIPVRDATDVLVAVSLARSGREVSPSSRWPGTLVAARGRRGRGRRRAAGGSGSAATSRGMSAPTARAVPTSGPEQAVLAAVDDTPTSFETILVRTDLSIAVAAEACDGLVTAGVLRSGAGWWSKR